MQVEGQFHSQEAVSLIDEHGMEFARGLVSYDSDELRLLMKAAAEKGRHLLDSSQCYKLHTEIVHR